MNCEHFLFNGEVKYDVRVLATVSDLSLHLTTKYVSVPGSINRSRLLITQVIAFFICSRGLALDGRVAYSDVNPIPTRGMSLNRSAVPTFYRSL